ncbi:MAG: YIP1 family protein [Candidatus Hydrothermales bacterium]
MDFVKVIEKVLYIIQLKEEAIKEVSEKRENLPWAILVVVIAGIASAIGSLKIIPGIITLPILAVILSFIGVGILWVVARILGGKGEYIPYYIPIAMTYILHWVSVIPIIGGFLSTLASIWMIIVAVKVTQTVHQLDLARAIIVVLIPIAIAFFLSILIGAAALTVAGLKGLGLF